MGANHRASWGPALTTAGLLVAVGCGEPPIDLRHVGPPDGHPDWVLALPSSDGYELYRWTDDSPALRRDRTGLDAELRAVALRPRADLAALGLPSGALPPSDPSGLPVLRDPLALEGLDPRAGAWRPMSGLPAELSDYRLGGACPRFGPARRLSTGTGDLRGSVAIGPDRVLLASTEGLWVVTSTSVRPGPELLRRSEVPRELARAGDRVWLTTNERRVYTGAATWPLELSWVPAPPAIGVGGFDDEDVFLVGPGPPHGVFHREAGDWRPIGEVERAYGPPVGVSAGRALVPTGVDGSLYRLSSTGVELERLGGGRFRLVERVPRLGTLIGTLEGSFLVEESQGWRRLEGEEFGWWVVDAVPFSGGFVGLLASGSVVPYVGFHPCPDLSYRGTLNAGRLERMQDGLLLASSIDGMLELLYVPVE